MRACGSWVRRWGWRLVAGLGVGVLAFVFWPTTLWPAKGVARVSCRPPAEVDVAPPSRPVNELVVLLHAFNSKAKDLVPMSRVVRETSPQAEILTCDLPFETLSVAKPEDVVADLLAAIDDAWEVKKLDGAEYEGITLVGHSMGSLFARKAYVVAAGETPCARFEPVLRERLIKAGAEVDSRRSATCPRAVISGGESGQRPEPLLLGREWAGAVDRIVLMAGMNRGWSISHHMSLTRAATMKMGVAVGKLRAMVYRRPPIIFAIRRGAPFLTQLRIQWLEMRRQWEASDVETTREERRAGGATVVQLLGSIDDLVSPEDNLDLVSGSHFLYLDVPWSGHRNVIDMAPGPEVEPGLLERLASPFRDPEEEAARARVAVEKMEARAAAFKDALTGEQETLADKQTLPVEMALRRQRCPPPRKRSGPAEAADGPETGDPAGSTAPAAPERKVTDVVFVIHGIRDKGFWTQKIARKVIGRARDDESRCVVAETSTYGYFPMLPFLNSRARDEKVEWLMDRYTEALALYPDARFHYVGHSNGTYLLAKALEKYRSVRFDRVVFAGSVVRTGYPWRKAVANGQVGRVLNFVATFDWVVGFFPKGFELSGWQDLGSAGHDGFDEWAIEPRSEEGDPRYVEGGHGEALEEEYWDAIAEFVLADEEFTTEFGTRLPKELKSEFSPERVSWMSRVAQVAPLLWFWILGILSAGFYGLSRLPFRESVRTVVVIGYVVLIGLVLLQV